MTSHVDDDFHWRDLAHCRTLSVEEQDLFISDRERDQRQAQLLCAPCLVKEDCFWYATETKTRVHVWGGLLPAQRTRLLKALSRRGYHPDLIQAHIDEALSAVSPRA